MKLYYTDWLAAVYMAREFGVKFKTPRGQNMYWDGGSDFRTEKDCGVYGGEYWYINPDSLDVFKPRRQDVGLDGASRVCKYVGSKWIVLDAPRHECEPVYPIETISRGQVDVNLRRFYTPKKEE